MEGPRHFTNLKTRNLHGFPELIGPLREQNRSTERGWNKGIEREREERDQQPTVIIVGGGKSGLAVAARLKYLGVKTLIVEREARIGELWRKRYEELCLLPT
jgi:NADPH-dependent 2,4-dienoyl-CoA reductase/sulfur reductase-like enzyme